MTTLRKLSWVELKLFLREPFTVILAFVVPIMFLVVLAGVFGNQPETNEGEETWRGVGPTDYYVPAYIGLVATSIGLVSVPVHLAGYREQGVLRRLRASSVPPSLFLGSQLVMSLATTVLSSLVLSVAALIAYDVPLPRAPGELLLAFLLGTFCLSAVGLALGSFLDSTRAAQGLGLVLFFVMMLLSGAGPPREALTGAMRALSDLMPLTYVVRLLQDGWLGFGWDAFSYAVATAVFLGSLLLSVRLFRWE